MLKELFRKILLTILFTLVLSGGALANFKLEKCKNVEVKSSVFSYEFFQDLKKVIVGEHNGQIVSYNEIKVKSYDYLDRNFIVFAETENYNILILEEEQIIVKIRKSDGITKKEKCK